MSKLSCLNGQFACFTCRKLEFDLNSHPALLGPWKIWTKSDPVPQIRNK